MTGDDASVRLLDLARREAEVALRVRRPTEPDLFGRRLADVAWAIYGAVNQFTPLRRTRNGFDFSQHEVIGWEEGVRQVAAGVWLDARVPPPRFVYRSSSLVNHLMAARAGIGIALLPCYLADPEGDIRRLSPLVAEVAGELWIVTHKELKDTARIRAFLATVGEGIAAERDLFEGRRRTK